MNVYLVLWFVVLASILWGTRTVIAKQTDSQPLSYEQEFQVTHADSNHLLTNIGCWSPDSNWLTFDTRSALDGSVFDAQTIQRVEVKTGQVQTLYRSQNGAQCGVVTYHPIRNQVVFILGPEHPIADWQYSAPRRQGVLVDIDHPGVATPLDARDLVPEFTPGALRGGTHVHTFSADGLLVASTYEDAILDQMQQTQPATQSSPAIRTSPPFEKNLRGIALSWLGRDVRVPTTHPRNHSGCSFTVLATKLEDQPLPGSDQIERACEEGWIGKNGYLRADGVRQRYALAFQGTVRDHDGKPVSEVFVLDIPEDLEELTQPGVGPLAGTATTRPHPPATVRQRRVTYTASRKHPGLSLPRHWLRSTADGSLIAFLAKDDSGVAQIFVVSPNGGAIQQVTHDPFPVSSAFSIHPSTAHVAYVADNSVFIVEIKTGEIRRLTPATPDQPPRPEACVFSPDGRWIAFMRSLPMRDTMRNQIFVVASGL